MKPMQASAPPMTAEENHFQNYVYEHRAMGYGRMLQMISGLWRDEAGDAAHCVNDTFRSLAAKKVRCKKEGHDWRPGTEFMWCDRCGASKVRRSQESRKDT